MHPCHWSQAGLHQSHFHSQPWRIRRKARHLEECKLQGRKNDVQYPSPCEGMNFISWIGISCIKSPWLTSAHLENGLSRSWALEEPGEECDSEKCQMGLELPKPHPTQVVAGQGSREWGPVASPPFLCPPVAARLCQLGLSRGRPHPAFSVRASCPAVLQEATHIHREAARMSRISSPSSQNPSKASLVWLCFPLQSHSGLLEQQVNHHIGEAILHSKMTWLFQETHMCVDAEALFLQNLARCVPAFTLVLHGKSLPKAASSSESGPLAHLVQDRMNPTEEHGCCYIFDYWFFWLTGILCTLLLLFKDNNNKKNKQENNQRKGTPRSTNSEYSNIQNKNYFYSSNFK